MKIEILSEVCALHNTKYLCLFCFFAALQLGSSGGVVRGVQVEQEVEEGPHAVTRQNAEPSNPPSSHKLDPWLTPRP